MTIAEQERERSARYREVLPRIVDGLEAGVETVALADALAGQTGLSAQETYRWIQLTEESVERFRRRRAIVTVVPIWAGGLLLVISGLMLLLGEHEGRTLLTGGLALTGAVGVVSFTIRGRRLSEKVYPAYKAAYHGFDRNEGKKTD